jgi:hypothetical protein
VEPKTRLQGRDEDTSGNSTVADDVRKKEVYMQIRIIALAGALCAAVSFAACSSELPTRANSIDSSESPGAGAQTSESAAHSTEPMRVFPSGAVLSGTSTLTRNNNGISMTVQANDLVPGRAYTVWFVIFNSPEGCIGACDVTDVLANRGVPSLRYGAGHVAGDSGQGNFAGRLATGNTGGPPCAADANLGSCGPGLLDSRTAVIHLVVRSHGPAIPELVNEQISSFGGGCQVNTCANVQYTEHLP